MKSAQRHQRSPNTDIVLCDPGGRRQFQESQIGWLKGREKQILPCDYSIPDELNGALQESWDVYTHATLHPELFDKQTRNTVRVIASTVAQCTRKWMILGQLGYWLRDVQPDISRQHATIPLILGSWHEDSARRLTTLGVPTATHPIVHSDGDTYEEYGKVNMAMTYNGYASEEQLSMMLPFDTA